MPRLIPVAVVVSALVLTALGASAAPPLPSPSPSRTSAHGASSAPDASTVTFVSDRAYVVSATVGSRVLRGRGTLPDGFSASSVTARPARDVLGGRGVEVLVDYGSPAGDMSARAYGAFTLHRGKLRPVTLDHRPLALFTYTEGGDEGGFRCRGGRLALHWFHHGSARGEQTVYRLARTRLVEVSRTALRRPVASRPTSCG